jgi:hypothetical protein
MILRLRQACMHPALFLNTFENDDSKTTGGYAEADPNACYMSVLSSNDAYFQKENAIFRRNQIKNIFRNIFCKKIKEKIVIVSHWI